MSKTIVYAVIHSDYDQYDVLGLYLYKSDAQKHIADLDKYEDEKKANYDKKWFTEWEEKMTKRVLEAKLNLSLSSAWGIDPKPMTYDKDSYYIEEMKYFDKYDSSIVEPFQGEKKE